MPGPAEDWAVDAVARLLAAAFAGASEPVAQHLQRTPVDEFAAYAAGLMSASESECVERHLATCEPCSVLMASVLEMARQFEEPGGDAELARITGRATAAYQAGREAGWRCVWRAGAALRARISLARPGRLGARSAVSEVEADPPPKMHVGAIGGDARPPRARPLAGRAWSSTAAAIVSARWWLWGACLGIATTATIICWTQGARGLVNACALLALVILAGGVVLLPGPPAALSPLRDGPDGAQAHDAPRRGPKPQEAAQAGLCGGLLLVLVTRLTEWAVIGLVVVVAAVLVYWAVRPARRDDE